MAATGGLASSVLAAIAPTVLIAANTARYVGRGPSVVVINDSSAILYVLIGPGTVSSTLYTYALAAKSTVGAVLELVDFRGGLMGIWASATGSALVTEVL